MATRPNIMLLQCEDVGRHFGCYGDAYARTPHIDALAAQATRYTNAFSHAPVCAPSRGGMVTGSYPYSIGNHLMRCTLRQPPRMFTHELRDAGYHVSWATKLDFNFDPTPGWCTDQDAWWQKPAPTRPFFVYRNFGLTHESRMFNPVPDWHGNDFPCPPEFRHRPEHAPVPPYLPDIPELRQQLATYYDAVSAIDFQIGECLRWLDATGQADNTIVILLSDHGRGLPREKRWCYDAGLHLPLIVRWPGQLPSNTINDELIAWVDIAPTLLHIAGVPAPNHYQGQCLLGPDRAPQREFVFAGRDRMDEIFDKQRVARDHRYHYVRNDAPGLPWAQKQWYMEQQPIMPVMRRMHAAGQLTGDAAIFFGKQKPVEELFDTHTDPDCLRNLATDPAHRPALLRLRAALARHLATVGDLGDTDERQLVARGLVTDKFAEYAERHERGQLPPEQQLGPQPIPMTLDDARPWLRQPDALA